MHVRFVMVLVAVVALAQSLFAGAITGRVFLDLNANGAADPGEPPVAGCQVSDETMIARTDAAGRYTISRPEGPATVFVINAPGTWPLGRWWQSLAGGAADRIVDFPLRQDRQDGPFYLVHGSDIHLRPEVLARYQRYLNHLNGLPVTVAVVVHTGDLVVDALRADAGAARKLFDLYHSANQQLKHPLRSVLGSHDIVGVSNAKVPPDAPGFGKALFRERVGPIHHAFRHGTWHFIALDCSTLEGRAVRSGLTKESADWAIQYLAGVVTNEPVVLLTHQPLFPEQNGERDFDPAALQRRPHENRLLAALKGRRLRLTLAGHVHNRGDTRWGGALHAFGGAVSYAWHGLLPYPNTPRGYALYRFDDQRSERVFLDWAEERSIDITSPGYSEVVFARQIVRGSIVDFSGDVTGVEVAIGGLRFAARTNRPGTMATAFAAEVDAATLPDGVYDLTVTARAGAKRWEERQPVVVYNALPETFRARAPARLTFSLTGETTAPGRVIVNGRAVGDLPAGQAAGHQFGFDVPAERLRRLNEIRIEAGFSEGQPRRVVVKNVSLKVDGKEYRDVRYSPLAPRVLNFGQTDRSAFLISYVDLKYPDLLGQSTRERGAK